MIHHDVAGHRARSGASVLSAEVLRVRPTKTLIFGTANNLQKKASRAGASQRLRSCQLTGPPATHPRPNLLAGDAKLTPATAHFRQPRPATRWAAKSRLLKPGFALNPGASDQAGMTRRLLQRGDVPVRQGGFRPKLHRCRCRTSNGRPRGEVSLSTVTKEGTSEKPFPEPGSRR